MYTLLRINNTGINIPPGCIHVVTIKVHSLQEDSFPGEMCMILGNAQLTGAHCSMLCWMQVTFLTNVLPCNVCLTALRIWYTHYVRFSALIPIAFICFCCCWWISLKHYCYTGKVHTRVPCIFTCFTKVVLISRGLPSTCTV